MRHSPLRLGLTCLMLSALTVGCTHSVAQQKPPPDPLLWSKRAVAGKATSTDSKQSARLDPPAMLPGPDNALASNPVEASSVTMQLPREVGR